MTPRVVPALRGARWLGEGWRLFRVSPFGWIGLLFGYWLLMSVVSLVPWVGLAAASVLVPPFSVAFMAAARAAAAGARVEPALLFAGFRENAGAQLTLGAVYAGLFALMIGATMLVDGGALARWFVLGEHPAQEAAQPGGMFSAMLAAAALYLPVMMLFWFSPVLTAWHGFRPGKALFYSFFACLMNWRAFVVYGVVTVFVTTVLPFFVLTALAVVAGGEPRINPMALVLPLAALLLPTLFASFYVSYRDIFGAPPAAAGRDEAQQASPF